MLLPTVEGNHFVNIGVSVVEGGNTLVDDKMHLCLWKTQFKAVAQRHREHRIADATETDN